MASGDYDLSGLENVPKYARAPLSNVAPAGSVLSSVPPVPSAGSVLSSTPPVPSGDYDLSGLENVPKNARAPLSNVAPAGSTSRVSSAFSPSSIAPFSAPSTNVFPNSGFGSVSRPSSFPSSRSGSAVTFSPSSNSTTSVLAAPDSQESKGETFGTRVRAFKDTASMDELVLGLPDATEAYHSNDLILGEGSFGQVRAVPFVYKTFKGNTDNYNPGVLQTLKRAKADGDTELSDIIVWSSDTKLEGGREVVVMENLRDAHTNMSRMRKMGYVIRNALGGKLNEIEFNSDVARVVSSLASFYNQLLSWLGDCFRILEEHALYCPDFKAANLGYLPSKDKDNMDRRVAMYDYEHDPKYSDEQSFNEYDVLTLSGLKTPEEENYIHISRNGVRESRGLVPETYLTEKAAGGGFSFRLIDTDGFVSLNYPNVGFASTYLHIRGSSKSPFQKTGGMKTFMVAIHTYLKGMIRCEALQSHDFVVSHTGIREGTHEEIAKSQLGFIESVSEALRPGTTFEFEFANVHLPEWRSANILSDDTAENWSSGYTIETDSESSPSDTETDNRVEYWSSGHTTKNDSESSPSNTETGNGVEYWSSGYTTKNDSESSPSNTERNKTEDNRAIDDSKSEASIKTPGESPVNSGASVSSNPLLNAIRKRQRRSVGLDSLEARIGKNKNVKENVGAFQGVGNLINFNPSGAGSFSSNPDWNSQSPTDAQKTTSAAFSSSAPVSEYAQIAKQNLKEGLSKSSSFQSDSNFMCQITVPEREPQSSTIGNLYVKLEPRN